MHVASTPHVQCRDLRGRLKDATLRIRVFRAHRKQWFERRRRGRSVEERNRKTGDGWMAVLTNALIMYI